MTGQLDRLMPAFDHRERHTTTCDAPLRVVWDALHELSVDELRTARALTSARSLVSRVLGRTDEVASAAPEGPNPATRTGTRPALEAFAPRVVLEEEPREVVLADVADYAGAIVRRPDIPRGDLLAFVTFDEPGWSKVVMNFRLDPEPTGGTRISTETRVLSTDPRTRLRFRLYWLAVRAGSGLVRRDILAAVKDRATRGLEPDRV
jgi:hypothetical protein